MRRALLLPLLAAKAAAQGPSRPLHCSEWRDGFGEEVIVETELGKINGTRCGHLDHFLGVRYGEPPLRRLRFAPAVPKRRWAPQVMDATFYGPSCYTGGHKPQPYNASEDLFWDDGHLLNLTGSGGSEDCLWLNINRPAPAGEEPPSALLPVMVWIRACPANSSSFPATLADANLPLLLLSAGRRRRLHIRSA